MCDRDLWTDMVPGLGALGTIHYGNVYEDSTLEGMARRVLATSPDRFVLVGFSMGGFVARVLTLMAPERVSGVAFVASSARGYSAEEIVLARTDSRALAAVLETESSRIRPLPELRESELGSIFSPAFAREAIAAAPKWSGPFASNRGQHWLRIIEMTPSHTPQFDEIKELVRAGWLQQAEAQQERELTEELVESYRIIRAPAPQAAGETAAQ